MFPIGITEFMQLRAQGVLTYSCYQTSTTYYLTLSTTLGVLFQCSTDIDSATSAGFTP